jgi:hypothetical protein
MIFRRLSTSPGVPGPHAFAVRYRDRHVQRSDRVHRIPRSTFLTLRNAPLDECGTAQDMSSIPIFRNVARLRQIGTTGNFRMTRMRNFRCACRANQWQGQTEVTVAGL